MFALISFFVATPAAAEDWETVSDKDGVAVSRMEMPDSDLLAFRGIGTVEVPLARLVGVLLDTKVGPDWVDLLLKSAHVRGDQSSAVIYNHYDLSWPVSDRDYVLTRELTIDSVGKVVTASYVSVEDPARPVSDCCVRAVAYRTFWRFTSHDSDKTEVEVEVFTDPKGALPAWLVNMIQKGWPRNSILGLAARAGKDDVVPLSEAADW